MIFVDTNILIDVVTHDPTWFAWSQSQLANAAISDEQLAINNIVYAEFSVRYTDQTAFDAALGRLGAILIPTPRPALFLAGRAFQRYRASGGLRTGVLPDFLIGAHALVAGAPLITRDIRRYRTYFPGIELITPSVN